MPQYLASPYQPQQSHRTFACPLCQKTAYLSWPQAFCDCDASHSVLSRNVSEQQSVVENVPQWTEMVELDPEALRELIDRSRALRAVRP